MSIGHEEKIGGVEREEVLALAALGLLTPEETADLKPGEVAEMAEAAALLAENVPLAAPSPAVKNRLMSRVAAWESLKPLADVRPYDGLWINGGAPGVDIRRLFRDKATGRTTMLLRMEPGVSFPAHYHHDDEQCYVLKGDVRWGDLVYEEGDFVAMAENTTHPVIHSAGGNLLLIIAGNNEFVHA